MTFWLVLLVLCIFLEKENVMKLSSVFVCFVLFVALLGTAGAAMVDFELPTYTAGGRWATVDGWVDLVPGGTVDVVTPVAGDARVIAGSQSGRFGGPLSAAFRRFDAGPTEYGTGTIVSGHVMVDNTPGGTGELFFSHNGGHMPAGIQGTVGGNFATFGGVGAYSDTGIPFLANVDYLFEIELDLDLATYNAYATNVTAAGPRTTLGTGIPLALGATTISPGDYVTSGFFPVSRNNANVIYDDLDIHIVAPVPVQLLPEPIGFELPDYVAGSSVVGVDGWKVYAGTAVVDAATVLEGSQSLKVNAGVLERNFGQGTTHDDGSIVSARMMMDVASPAGSQASILFSDDIALQATPAGIFGLKDGNFWIFGMEDGAMEDSSLGLDSGVSFLTGVDYLLEMQLDLTSQTFKAYATNLTAGDPRVLLGSAEFAVTGDRVIEAGDGSNSGYFLVTRNGAVVVYDELNCAPVPEPSTMTALIGLLLGAFVCVCRRKAA